MYHKDLLLTRCSSICLFYFITEQNLANYAYDNTTYALNNKVEALIKVLENNTSILTEWFQDNYLKMNADKCNFLITNHHGDEVSAIVDQEIITAKKSVKLLGITIDNKLDFNEHISKLF